MGDSAGAILRAVLASGPVPRSAIARTAGLSPATVTWQTRSLIEAGLLVELPETTPDSGIGRPYVPLALDSADNVVIAVHIAAAQITVAVVDLAGDLRTSRRIPHRSTAAYDILADIVTQIAEVRATCDARILGLGVAIGGRVDRGGGAVIDHAYLRWRDVPVRDHLERLTGLPTVVDSHTRALMHAEHLYGRLRGTAGSVVLFVGNVVDVTFAVGEQVHYGPRSAAGSIGRMLASAGTGAAHPPDTERFSDHALLTRARALGIAVETVPDLVAAAGVPGRARELFTERAVVLGRIAAALIDLLDPEAMVIVDRGFTGVDGVARTYLRTIDEYSALCQDPASVVGSSTFVGRVLEMAGAGAALHEIFHSPTASLAALERRAV